MPAVLLFVACTCTPTLVVCTPTLVVCTPTLVVCTPTLVVCTPTLVVCTPTLVVCTPTLVVCTPTQDMNNNKCICKHLCVHAIHVCVYMCMCVYVYVCMCMVHPCTCGDCVHKTVQLFSCLSTKKYKCPQTIEQLHVMSFTVIFLGGKTMDRSYNNRKDFESPLLTGLALVIMPLQNTNYKQILHLLMKVFRDYSNCFLFVIECVIIFKHICHLKLINFKSIQKIIRKISDNTLSMRPFCGMDKY